MDALRNTVIGMAMVASVGMATTGVSAADRSGPYAPASAFSERPLTSIWHGLYAGVHAGFGKSGSADGFVGGAQLGYNWQSSQFVYGLEVDASLSDISVSESVSFGGMTASASASIDWMATLRGRIGILVDPRVLAYATAGFGIAHAKWDANAGGFGVGVSMSGSETDTGFVFGLGLEGKLSDTMTARIEYLGFTSLDAFGDDGIGVVRAGLNIKLGR